MQNTNIITQSNTMSDCLEHVSKAAKLNRPMLICGERGSGKELIAARLHFLSSMWDQPYIKINCAAITESLLESELFGHEIGAFTGATKVHKGKFERADGGTLFLDEVGTMSGALQEKLLRVIEYGEFERVGSQTLRQLDVRVIGATHENLPKMVEQGRFRADLLDRLAFDVINVPPLRERDQDVELLVEHFAQKMALELQWPYFPGFDKKCMAQLNQEKWPGNIRQLKNTIERSMYLWMDEDELKSIEQTGSELRVITSLVLDPFATNKEMIVEAKNKKLTTYSFKEKLDSQEKALLIQALKQNDFKQVKTADFLQITYHQLRALIRKYPDVLQGR
ncbi:MAG: sigma 54-interacting transcriptional regulator [Saccharospirillaceae bacterium]|nr:sigma 54-interacting transcriptional regulator [Pseudomonadales bacterium]NRB78041.1 sigma 54-interacting transcriptional regulator [Saccharospirillaceae bacterium]